MLNGFKSNASDRESLALELTSIKTKFNELSDIEFGKVLGEEIALLNDYSSLRIPFTRNPNLNLFEQAEFNCNLRVDTATKIGANTKYNLSIGLKIILLNDKYYYHVLAGNNSLYAAFSGLENISYDDSRHIPGLSENELSNLWKHILNNGDLVRAENYRCEYHTIKENIVIPELEERLHSQAFYATFNYYLSQLTMNASLPPALLAPYIEEALSMISQPSGEQLLQKKKKELRKILFPINVNSRHLYE